MAVKMLKKDGTFGEFDAFGFVSAETIKQYLAQHHAGMFFTVGLAFRNPRTYNKWLSYEKAIEALDAYKGWFLQATHNGSALSVSALNSNDLW